MNVHCRHIFFSRRFEILFIENQQCSGKFAADLEFCCREPTAGYPVNIPVYIRGHLVPPQITSFSQQLGTHSVASVAPSAVGGIVEEQTSQVKRSSGGRIPSISHSGILTGVDNDNRSFSTPGK